MTKRQRLIAITGANGFVGRHVVERLLREPGYTLRCVTRESSDLSALAAYTDRVTFMHGDITRQETLEDAFEGAWGVINLAGYRDFWSQHRDHFYELNQRGAAKVFKACLARQVKKVVQVSTPLAFGMPDRIPFDESTPAGHHPSDYAKSKYLGDQAGWQLHKEYALPLTVLHLAAVIGAGDDKATMEVRRVMEGRLPALVGAETTYTYLYVRDAADAIVRAVLSDEAVGRSFLVGNQRATTRDYFKMIGQLAGVDVPDRNIPEALLLPVAGLMEQLARWTGRRPVLPLDVLKTTAAGSLLFDVTRSVEELGMSYTPLESALAESVEELRAADYAA